MRRAAILRKAIAAITISTIVGLAFVGVQPLKNYKDYTIAKFIGFRMVFYQTPEEAQASYERDIATAFERMNKPRPECCPLIREPLLDELAMNECLHMKEVGHMTHPDTSEWVDYVHSQEGNYDYTYPQTASNACEGTDCAYEAVVTWLHSKMGHKGNILSLKYKRAGLAFVVASRFWGTGYACLIVSE